MFKYIKFDLFLKASFNEGGRSLNWEEQIKTRLEQIKKELWTRWFLDKLKSEVANWWNIENGEYKRILSELSSIKKDLESLKNTSQDAREKLWALLTEVESKLESSVKILDEKELQSITNADFLRMNFEERLKYITKWVVNYSDVANWTQKSLEFSFTFNWKLNRDLFYKTTAGQVLPPEVTEVSIWWEVYSRVWLYWEFFTTSNKRLIINDGTKIEITKVRWEQEVAQITAQNEQAANEYLKQEPNSNKEIIKWAINRWIDPKFTVIAFQDNYDKTPDWDKKVVLEDMLTEFDRYRWSFWYKNELKDWKYSPKLALWMLSEFNKDNWKQKAIEYWIIQKDIDDYISNWENYIWVEANSIENDDSLPEWWYKKWEKLLNDPAFSKRLDEVCASIGANRSDMIKMMKAESRLDSRIINKQSWATWLIQFMPDTATWLWTSTWKLRAMTALEQLDYVEKYFKQNSRWFALNDITTLYQVVFFPASLWKDKSWVFDAKDAPAHKVAKQNNWIASFSTRPDGLIDWYCFEKYVSDHVSKFSA